MNRQYSRDGLLKMYQQEASDNRDKKAQEKQSRLMEERVALDALNREIEQEKRTQYNSKMQRMNERMEEYNHMLQKKQFEKEENRNRKKGKDDLGTFKIGGENREIRKKNYDEVSNNLVLNPMRENVQMGSRGRNETTSGAQVRGKSQGFNIINHTAYDSMPKMSYGRVNNMMNGENERTGNMSNNMQNIMQNNNFNQVTSDRNQMNREVEGIENLENFPYSREIGKERIERGGEREQPNYPQREQTVQREEPSYSNPNPEYDEAEFQKYYEEYMRQKMREEEMAAAMESKANQENRNMNIPTTMKEYEAYKNSQPKYPQGYNEDNYGSNV